MLRSMPMNRSFSPDGAARQRNPGKRGLKSVIRRGAALSGLLLTLLLNNSYG